MKKKKILFIIQSYPVEKSANVLCDTQIIHALLEMGKYEIHVLGSRYWGQPAEDIFQGVHVHRISRGWWQYVIDQNTNKAQTKLTKLILMVNRICLRIKQILTIPIYPYFCPITILIYYFRACKLMQREHFDLVIAEHHGLDRLMAGYLLKKKFPQVKFMPIFWDALSGGFSPKYLPKFFSLKRRKNLELKIFKTADKVIAMQSHEQHIRSCFDSTLILKKVIFLNIPYFVKPKLNRKSIYHLSTHVCNIVFAGNLWERNPEPLFQILHKCNISNVKIWIISGSRRKAHIESLAHTYHIDTQYLDFVPHSKLGELLTQSSILLNFGVKNPNAISGKIFEYMGFGKPIISTYSIDNEACIPYLQKYPLSFLLDERKADDPTQIAQLRAFIEQNANKYVPYEQIAPLFYANTPQAYVEEINNLLENA